MDTIQRKNHSLSIINYLVIFTVFADALSFIHFPAFEIRITCLILLIILILILPFLKRIYFNRSFCAALGIIIVLSLLNVVMGNNTMILLLKQLFAISLNSLVFYLLVKLNSGDIKKLFSVYLNLALIIAIIGLIQEAAYVIKIPCLYSFGYFIPKWIYPERYNSSFLRLNSILSEPSSFCFALMPAFFAAVTSFCKKDFKFMGRTKSLIFMVTFLFTFSSIGYIGIILSVALLIYYSLKAKSLIVISVVVVFSLGLIYKLVPEFQLRTNDMVYVMRGQTKLEVINQSTFALLSNALVTVNVFKSSPLFGNGLGSYAVSFKKYIGKIINPSYTGTYSNEKDANSLFLRLLAETGLLGLVLFLYFLVSSYLSKNNDPSRYLWIINNGILILFIMRLIRQGHYFSEGFFFFFWLYYFSKRTSAAYKRI